MEPESLGEVGEASLKEACTQETANYLRHTQYDPRYCFELFRRLLAESQIHLMAYLMENYRSEVQTWTRSHAAFEHSGLEADELLGSAFMRLYRSCSGDAFYDFHNLAALLSFLQRCVQNILIDIVRQDKQPPIVPLDDWMEETAPGDSPAMDADLVATDLWACICGILDNERDIAIARYTFVQQMKPAAIADELPDLTAQDVSKCLYRIRQKLRAHIHEC